MRVQNFFETWKLIYRGTKWFWVMIIDPSQYKIILKLDNWLMSVQNGNLIIGWCGYKMILKFNNGFIHVQNDFEILLLINASTKRFWNLIIDWCGYKTILEHENWLIAVENDSETS